MSLLDRIGATRPGTWAIAHVVSEKYWPLLVKKWPAYERFFADTHQRAVFVLQRR